MVLLYILRSDLINVWISIFPIIFLSTMAIEKVYLKVDFQERFDNYTAQKKEEMERDEELKKFKSLFFERKRK